jgi:hypothetical protein
LTLPFCGAAFANPLSPGLYEVTTETGMPHLEENLRYAVVTEQRCMDPEDLSAAFWMLERESLQDCRLSKVTQQSDAASYALICTGGHGTVGNAQWRFEPQSLTGTMSVKLGGKNMTFYQRIVAKRLGQCPAK